MSQSFKLYRLQQIDSQLDKARNRLKAIESQLKVDEELRQADLHLANADANLDRTARILRSTELDVQNQRIKIEETESALYGGKIRNPKELQDLQNESASLKRYLVVLEDRQLEAMIALEEAESEQQAAIQAQTRARFNTEQRNASLLAEQKGLRQDVGRLEGERSASIVTIPEVDVNVYEKLRVQRGGIAVARIVDRTCAACGSTLSSALLNTSQLPNQISRCSRCNRILYAG